MLRRVCQPEEIFNFLFVCFDLRREKSTSNCGENLELKNEYTHTRSGSFSRIPANQSKNIYFSIDFKVRF